MQTLERKVIKVTENELTNILSNIPNTIGSFAKILQLTNVKFLKKDRETKEKTEIQTLKKVSALNVLVSTSYESGVLNQLKKEEKSETEYEKGVNTMPLNFENSKNTFVGDYKGKGVLQYRPFEKSYPVVKYIVDGKLTDKEKIPNVLPISSSAKNQGTEKEILWRKIYISNIRKISINKKIYVNIDCMI